MWFNTTSSGVLLSKTNGAAGQTLSSGWTNLLYVGTDGRLYSEDFPGGGIRATTQAVNDGKWHHAILAVSATQQTVYVDGVK